MAMSMPSAFTTADRRKRIATYGKSSRTAKNFNWNEEASSPERPRKKLLSLNGTLKRPGGAIGAGSASERPHTNPLKSPATRDIFDVPSGDEAAPLPSPALTKKPSPKQAAPVDEFHVPSSGDEAVLPKRRLGKTLQPARQPISARKKLPKPNQVESASSNDPPMAARRRAKTPQPPRDTNNGERSQVQAAKRPVVKPKIASRATTPAPPAPVSHKRTKSASALPSKKPAAKLQSDLDIFDVPSSEEDVPLRTPRRPLPVPLSRAKTPTKPRAPSAGPSPGGHIESDDSNASKKRKRQPSVSSSAAPKVKEVLEKKREPSVPQRSKKYQKKDNSVSPGHGTNAHTMPIPPIVSGLKEPLINKPKRTRVRTVPGPARAPITKGQSSPAKLHGMLAVRPLPKPSPVAEIPEDLIEEDTTMYDIQNPTTPLVRSTKVTIPGSVTPRQKAIFDNLLGDSSAFTTPGMPSISRLRLTDRRPGSLVSGLARSSSDIPQTTYSRKPRLIDTLKQAAPSSEEEDSESDEETEGDITESSAVSAPATETIYGKDASSTKLIDEMDLDSEPPTNSQASQSAIHMNIGAKVTYAKQRSYIEETSLEDGLLLSMDLDGPLNLGGFGSTTQANLISDDEDDPASQVRGIHELRKQGQNQKFRMEAQSAIDDISGKGGLGNSVRRSVMMEFCIKMADEKFIEQLLESALGHQFLGSITSKGETIFDFAAAVAIAFILKTGPEYTVLDQIYRSNIMSTLPKLLDFGADISRIAKDRKTNMSKVGQESVTGFRTLVQSSSIWSQEKPDKVSPQIVAMKTLELLVLGLRKAGSTEALVDEGIISKLLDITSAPCNRLKSGRGTPQDLMMLNLAFSIMEGVSVSKERQATWSNEVVQRLVEMMPAFFETSGASPIKLAIRLCMNLTNNKPKACDAFAGPTFVRPLVRSISHKFTLLAGELEEEQRNETMEGLILSLGAMMNLAEFSDEARASVVVDSDELIDALVNIFLEGSERAAKADSMEESQSSVIVGYLTVLLGNLCLNELVRYKVRSRLPGQKMDMLVDKVREFVRYNERVDRDTNQFEGEEGRETWRIFTMRLMLVVERLEKAEA